ncbi:MAG: glycosyltransferase family 4 protein [Chloroflexota bacterium]
MPHNILFVNTPTYIGGAEISLLILAEELQRRGHSCWLLTTGEGPLTRRAEELGIPVWIQPFPWLSRRKPGVYVRAILQIALLLRRFRIDIVHTNCDRSLPIMRWACRIAGRPYVSHVRDFVRGWFQPSGIAGLKDAQRVLANSNAVADVTREAGLASERIITVYSPIDVASLEPTAIQPRNHGREHLNLSPEHLVIGIVGQIQSIKGHREFVTACLAIAAILKDACFLIVGDPPPDSLSTEFSLEIQGLIASSPYGDRFFNLGFQGRIGPVLRSVDILAVPSWKEPFGRVAVEGLAAGCAVIASDSGGLPEIVVHDVNGLLIPPGDALALSHAFLRLATDPALRQRLARAGLESARQFTIARHVDVCEDVYRTVVNEQLPKQHLAIATAFIPGRHK